MVQSPKISFLRVPRGWSCEYIANSINEFLISMRDKVKNISDEEFEVHKSAVMTRLAEKDISLSQENQRHFGEISTHHYLFDRQAKQIEQLKTITKGEFIDLFESTFFSEKSKRIDLMLNSEAHGEENEKYR